MITIQKYAAGETVITEGEPGEHAYLIESGKVQVTRLCDGQELVLATLGPGEIFGEMSIIDEKPRSATVRCVEDTMVQQLHRDDLSQTLSSEPEVAFRFLGSIFERLRDANARLAVIKHVNQETPANSPSASTPPADAATKAAQVPGLFGETKGVMAPLLLEGKTPRASMSLETNPLQIEKFPFTVGRRNTDPFSMNDLSLVDCVPFQVSRNHLKFIQNGDSIAVVDRGSTLGAVVNGTVIGGSTGNPGPVPLENGTNDLILGNQDSDFVFELTVN